MDDILRLRTLATKLTRKRLGYKDEDAEQEAWIAAWKAHQKAPNEGYVVQSVKNRLNDYARGSRLGGNRPNHPYRPKTVSVDALIVPLDQQVRWGREDTLPIELSWATDVAKTRDEKILLAQVFQGEPVHLAPTGWARSTNQKYWYKLKPRLQEAWKETIK